MHQYSSVTADLSTRDTANCVSTRTQNLSWVEICLDVFNSLQCQNDCSTWLSIHAVIRIRANAMPASVITMRVKPINWLRCRDALFVISQAFISEKYSSTSVTLHPHVQTTNELILHNIYEFAPSVMLHSADCPNAIFKLVIYLHFAWVVDDAKYIVITRVCVSVSVSVRARMPTLLHGPGCNLG